MNSSIPISAYYANSIYNQTPINGPLPAPGASIPFPPMAQSPHRPPPQYSNNNMSMSNGNGHGLNPQNFVNFPQPNAMQPMMPSHSRSSSHSMGSSSNTTNK